MINPKPLVENQLHLQIPGRHLVVGEPEVVHHLAATVAHERGFVAGANVLSADEVATVLNGPLEYGDDVLLDFLTRCQNGLFMKSPSHGFVPPATSPTVRKPVAQVSSEPVAGVGAPHQR